jgi:ATP-dependent Lhr-like helicase
LRESYASLLGDDTAPLEELPDGVTWHTFAGGAVNRLLSAGLEETSGKRWVAGNLSLRCKDVALTVARDAVAGLAALDWERVAAAAARSMARGVVSKFQPCLPEAAEDRLLAEKLLDLPSTLRFLAGAKVHGTHVTLRPAGVRLLDGETRGSLTIELRSKTPVGEAAGPKNPIEWVDAPAALRALAEQLAALEVVGLDVETTLDFRTLCLVQIATRTRTYLIDPFAVADLTALAPVMDAPRPQKVIHNARFERRMLAGVGLGLAGVIDTLEVSRRVRGADVLGGHSLGMVCERELGMIVDKSQQTSNWSQRPLDAGQLRYAALDAEILLRLHDRFEQLIPDAWEAPA